MNWKFSTLAFVTLLCACSNSRDVVQNGPFQHRKYVNKGWFLDLPSAHKADRTKSGTPVVATAPEAAAAEVPASDRPLTAMDMGLQAAPAVDASTPVVLAEVPGGHPLRTAKAPEEEAMAQAPAKDEAYGMRASSAKKVGAATAAIPALLAPRGDDVGGINIFALLGFIFAFLLPLAGLILSLIGMHQTSPGDGHGHGLAVAGLIISIIALIIVVTVVI